MSYANNQQSTLESKSSHNVELQAIDDEIHDLEFDRGTARKWATAHDIRDMDALGLTPTFKRRFKFVAMVGFSSTVVVAWQNTLATFGFALYNGGTGGLFWTFVFSIIAMTFVYLSLAELSSSFPTAGGQYQWVAECAPKSARHFLSYCTGWLCTLAWITFLSGCSVIIGNLGKYCCILYYPDAAWTNSQWFPTLLSLASLVIAAAFNIHLAKEFPLIEGIMLFIHLASWAGIIVTLWVTSPRADSDVLFEFANGGAWPNAGIATLIGVLTPWNSVFGYDSSVHMTENAKDASKTIPNALMTSFAFNALLAFVAAITLSYCAGDTNSLFANPNQAPFVQLFLNSTKSRAATVIMVVPMILCFYSALISEVATASRQLWSFARDGGLPFADFLEPVWDLETPRRSVWTTVALAFCFACINFGPVAGFNAIVSLVSVALTFSYTITIFCTICRRVGGAPIPRERFHLGRWGMPINVIALCCVVPVTVLSVFPADAHPTLAYMNWASVVFGAVVVFAASYYVLVGRKRFSPPIRKEEY